VLGPARVARRIVYITDTIYKPGLASFCRDADLLIHEGMFGEDKAEEAHERKHCTAAQAATLARDAGARRLVLTHISARYNSSDILRDEAAAIFPGAQVAHDLFELEIPYRE